MKEKANILLPVKPNFHSNNIHKNHYNFEELVKACPKLLPFVSKNKFGNNSINFADSEAVKTLNTAILKHFYHINYWDIPIGYLCPAIPGRVDYIHYLADFFESNNSKIIGLDIGTGANLVYPIIGNAIYNWQFVATDIDEKALLNAQQIIDKNTHLSNSIFLRKQHSIGEIFNGIILQNDKFNFTICNPPFHESAAAANNANNRKNKNLHGRLTPKSKLNFGGVSNELWCNGGEVKFIENMIFESTFFAKQCMWFTTLVSNKKHLPILIAKLNGMNASETKVVTMEQGNKVSRILAWTFLSNAEKNSW